MKSSFRSNINAHLRHYSLLYASFGFGLVLFTTNAICLFTDWELFPSDFYKYSFFHVVYNSYLGLTVGGCGIMVSAVLGLSMQDSSKSKESKKDTLD